MDRTTRTFGKFAYWWGCIMSFISGLSLFFGDNFGSSLAMLIFFGIIPLVVGRNILKKTQNQQLPMRGIPMMERRLLLLASSTQGRFTLSEAALQMNLSLDMTKNVLESFVTKGLIEVDVDDNGVQHYIYRDIYLKQKN